MNENIKLSRLKTLMKTKGIKMYQLAEKCGVSTTMMSYICNGDAKPKTDFLAKICWALHVYPSEVVTFENIETNDDIFKKEKREPLPDNAEGLVTYAPLFYVLEAYTRYRGDITIKDIFDSIEPPRRINGSKNPDKSLSEKSVAARYGEGYVSKRTSRTDYSKGLTAITRVKLRNDRPLNLEVIYEICKYIGCSIDFVMGYK